MDISEELKRIRNYLKTADTAMVRLSHTKGAKQSDIDDLDSSLRGITAYVNAIEQQVG